MVLTDTEMNRYLLKYKDRFRVKKREDGTWIHSRNPNRKHNPKRRSMDKEGKNMKEQNKTKRTEQEVKSLCGGTNKLGKPCVGMKNMKTLLDLCPKCYMNECLMYGDLHADLDLLVFNTNKELNKEVTELLKQEGFNTLRKDVEEDSYYQKPSLMIEAIHPNARKFDGTEDNFIRKLQEISIKNKRDIHFQLRYHCFAPTEQQQIRHDRKVSDLAFSFENERITIEYPEQKEIEVTA